MKKTLSTIIAIIMILTIFSGCTQKNNSEKENTIRIGGLKGPTSMGMVKMLSDSEQGTSVNNYKYTLAASADELTPKLLKGELDILSVPVNLASVLYNNTKGNIKMLAVNTLGVIYIVERGEPKIKTIKDLKGKTIYATGKNTTPHFSLSYILSQYGINLDNDVAMIWKSEPSEVVATMQNEENSIAMIPQPFVTVAQNQIPDLTVSLDLTKEWDALMDGSRLITSCLIARSEFTAEHPDLVKTFMKEYEDSAAFANTNPEQTAELIEKHGIVKADIAQKAIPYCNIVCITGNDMKNSAKGFLTVLYNQQPTSVGSAVPDDNFYWIDE